MFQTRNGPGEKQEISHHEEKNPRGENAGESNQRNQPAQGLQDLSLGAGCQILFEGVGGWN